VYSVFGAGMVLSIDEKISIQALDRIQPGLPLKKVRCCMMTHDYKRHSTITAVGDRVTPRQTIVERRSRDTISTTPLSCTHLLNLNIYD
jgi:hypothetical protein